MEDASPINSALVDLALWLIMLVIILGLGIPYLSKGTAPGNSLEHDLLFSKNIAAFQSYPDVPLAPAQLILNCAYKAIPGDRIVAFEKVLPPLTDLTQPIAPLQITHKIVPRRPPDKMKQGTQLLAVSKYATSPTLSEQAKRQPDSAKISNKLLEDTFSPSSSTQHGDTASGDDPLSGVSSESERLFDSIIRRAAGRHQVDPYLVKAIIMAESSYNPRAISGKGAKGLMQLMPGTAKALGVEDSFNPEHNINAGVKYFKQLLNQFDGDVKLALAAYNAGSKKVKKYNGVPPYKATRYYVKKVFEYHKRYRQ